MEVERKTNWKKYGLAFLITAAIFTTALFISDTLSERRIEEIRSIENKLSINILSLETQLDLLQAESCESIKEGSALSREINTLARRLSYMEETRGVEDVEVIRLKEYYSILEIKDFLLMKRIAKECDIEPTFVLYFYSNAGDCADCEKAGHVLTYLRETYPDLRVYAFDYHLELSALTALKSLHGVEGDLPAIVIADQVLYGFQEKEELEAFLPASIQKATSTEAAQKEQEEK